MTILLDTDNKTILSISSGGFVDETLNTREYDSEIPEDLEDYIWNDKKKELVK